MDKETLIQLELDIINNKDVGTKYTNLLIDYCLEKGKDAGDIYKFLLVITKHPAFLYCVSIALKYFEEKFGVLKVQVPDAVSGLKTIYVY